MNLNGYTLKAVKTMDTMDGIAYSGNIYYSGKKIGMACNNGRGGTTDVHVFPGTADRAAHDSALTEDFVERLFTLHGYEKMFKANTKGMPGKGMAFVIYSVPYDLAAYMCSPMAAADGIAAQLSKAEPDRKIRSIEIFRSLDGFNLDGGRQPELTEYPEQETLNEKSILVQTDYKTIDLVASYEDTFAVPHEERLTRYWGDFGGHVRKDGVTDAQLRAVYEKALQAMEMDSDTFQGWNYGGRGDVVMHMRGCLLAKTLREGDEILFIPHCPTGPEGQFQYETGCVMEVDAAAKTCVAADADGEMTVPLRHVLARFDDDLPGNAFGYIHAQPLYYLPEPWARDLMCQAREAYEEQLAAGMDEDSGEAFGGMAMKM